MKTIWVVQLQAPDEQPIRAAFTTQEDAETFAEQLNSENRDWEWAAEELVVWESLDEVLQ